MDTFKSSDLKVTPQKCMINFGNGVNQEVYDSDISFKLFSFYEERLQDMMKVIYQKIMEDELISTLSENKTSSEFIEERIKEIMENCLLQEKEQLISKLLSDNEAYKFQIKKLENNNEIYAEQMQSVHNQMNKLNYEENLIILEEKIQKNVNELNNKNKQIEILNNKVSKLEEELQQKQKTIQQGELQIQKIELQLQNERDKMNYVEKQQQLENTDKKGLKQRYEELMSMSESQSLEFSNLRFRFEQSGIERINEQEQFKLLINQIKDKCKDKAHNLKIKYKQYKELSKNLQDKLIEIESDLIDKQQQNTDLKAKLSESQRNILEYQKQIGDFQREMKRLLEQLQFQTDEVERLKKIQQETINTLENKIEYNEKSLRNNLEESQQIIAEQQRDISSKNRQISELSSRLTQSASDHAMHLQQLANEADAQREDIQDELIANSNAMEQEILQLKNDIIRLQNEKVTILDENKKLFYDCHSKENKIKEFENQLKQKEDINNDLENKLFEVNQLSNNLDEQNRILDSQNQQYFNDNKQFIIQIEDQERIIQNMKEVEINQQSIIDQLQNEKNKLTTQLQNCREEFENYKSEIFQKYKEIENEKRMNLEGQLHLKESEISLKIEVERLQSEIKHGQLLFEEKKLSAQKEIEVLQILNNQIQQEKVKCLDALSEITKKYESLKEKQKIIYQQKEAIASEYEQMKLEFEEKQIIIQKMVIQLEQISEESVKIKEQFSQKLRQIEIKEESIQIQLKENQRLNGDLNDLLQEKNNCERKLQQELQELNNELEQSQQQIQIIKNQTLFDIQQTNLQAEREKQNFEAQISSLDQRYKELQQKLQSQEEEQEEYIETIAEKESTLNQQKNLLSEFKIQSQIEIEQLKQEIFRLTESFKLKEIQIQNFVKQQKEYTRDKLKNIQYALQQSKQEFISWQQKFTQQINDTHQNSIKLVQNALQFFRNQKNKLQTKYENDMEKYQENISIKFEQQFEKEKAIINDKELQFKKQTALLEQKISELNLRVQEEKTIGQRQQNALDEKYVNEKLLLSNEIISLKNEILKIETNTARTQEIWSKSIANMQVIPSSNQIKSNSQMFDHKNKISEAEKKELQILEETRSKIHNMKAHLRTIDFDDSNDQIQHSSSSTSSVPRNNNVATSVPKYKNNLGEMNKANVKSDNYKKESENTLKQNKYDKINKPSNYSNSSCSNSSTLKPQTSVNQIQNSDKIKKINNLMDGINYTLGSSPQKLKKSPPNKQQESSSTYRNRSSTNHQVSQFDPRRDEMFRQKNASVYEKANSNSIKQSKPNQNTSSYKKVPIKEESKQSNRQFNNSNNYSQQKIEKNQSSSFQPILQNNISALNYQYPNSQRQDQNQNDMYSSPFKHQEIGNTFVYSPDTTKKSSQQLGYEQLFTQIPQIRDNSRSTTPTYLSTLAERSLQELKLEIIKQKQRLTISRNNSQEFVNNHSSTLTINSHDQGNQLISQFLIKNKYNNQQNSSQNDLQDSQIHKQQNSLNQSQQNQHHSQINLKSLNQFKYASPSPNKSLLTQQQKLLQQSSQVQSSKKRQGSPLNIQDL